MSLNFMHNEKANEICVRLISELCFKMRYSVIPWFANATRVFSATGASSRTNGGALKVGNQRNYCGKFPTSTNLELASQEQAMDLVRRLKKEEMQFIKVAIQHYESDSTKEKFEGIAEELLLYNLFTKIVPQTVIENSESIFC